MMSTKSNLLHNSLILLAAMIWGFAFIAQKEGMKYIGPFTFNAIRFSIGSILLLILYYRKINKLNYRNLYAGTILGFLLFFGATFQQIGIVYTQAGNAGFITSLYMIFIPIIGLKFKRKTSFKIWFIIFLAITGFFFLSIDIKTFSFSLGDFLVFIGAIFWALHVSVIEYFAKLQQSIILAFVQFSVTALISLLFSFIIESPSTGNIIEAWLPLAYAGFLSVGVAFTLQIYAQQYVPANIAGILFSSESLFALLGGILLLNEHLNTQQWLGVALIFVSIILIQILQFRKTVIYDTH